MDTRAFLSQSPGVVADGEGPGSLPIPAFPPRPIPFRYRTRLPSLTKNALCNLASHLERYLPLDPTPGYPARMSFTELAREFKLGRWRQRTKGSSVYRLLEQFADSGTDLGGIATCIIKRGVRLRRLRGVRLRISYNPGQEPVWREDIAEACALLARMGIVAEELKDQALLRGIPQRLHVEMDWGRNTHCPRRPRQSTARHHI